MSLNRAFLCALGLVFLFTARLSLAGPSTDAVPAPSARSRKGTTATEQEVLKRNEECNAAELRADVAAMDRCETEDFTHTHSNGLVENKIGFIKGVGSGAHKFLTLDWSDVHVRTYGDSAIVEGHQHLRADNLGRIADNQLAVMTVWVKQQGKWREAAWIAALISRAQPAVAQNK
jgi:ketosteroid isomerase-like protein